MLLEVLDQGPNLAEAVGNSRLPRDPTRRHPRRTDRLSLGGAVKSRYPDDTLASVPPRHFPAGLAGCVDPVWFASGVGERPVGLDRIVFDRVDAEQFPAL